MQDNVTKQLDVILPELIDAINKILIEHQLKEIVVDQIDFIQHHLIDENKHDSHRMAFNLREDIKPCPPRSQITHCITCVRPDGTIITMCPHN